MIGVAVIGAGHWGPNLIRNFDHGRRSEVLWVVEQDPARQEQVADRFPDLKLASAASDALKDPRVDAVVVATPTITHYALAKDALQSGKHVFVEKPITADGGQADELCSLARRHNLVLMVGHVFIYNAGVRHVKEVIDEGGVGRVYYVSMARTNLGPIRVDVNAAWDLAAHDISIANYWLEAEPLTASALGGSWINNGIEDAIFATLRYPNDVLVNLHASWLNPCKTREIAVVGDRQMLTFDDGNLKEPVRIYDKWVTGERTVPFVDSFASFRASIREGDVRIPRVPHCEPLDAECQHFLDCIVESKTPITDGTFGASVVRAVEAIECSIANRGCEEDVSS
jgi:predicted dehydrogenase